MQCIVFQERRLFRQLHQHLAVRRSGRRHGSLDEQAAHAVFQRLDSLRHRRRRHAQGQRGALEAAFAHNGGQRPQVAVIEFHGLVLLNIVKEN
ncbi:hypothetical protein G6F65_018883 [Rhizopus arrhizus]|nr:hypothetical protein G6F65_018883 [Rhizopus arrhizus]